MKIKTSKKIIISSILVLLTFLFVIAGTRNKSDSNYIPIKYESSLFDVSSETDGSYKKFINSRSKVFPNIRQSVDLNNYEYQNGLFDDDIPYVDNFIDENKITKTGVYVPETGDISFLIDVESEGFYNMNIDYFNIEGRGASITRGIKINDSYQYLEAENISFLRFWKDEHNVSDNRQKGVNDLRPKQIEINLWENTDVYDHMGYYNEPYYFWFEKGVNKITFVSHREPIVIGELSIYQSNKIKTYDEYIKENEQKGIIKNDTEFSYIREAEEAYLKSSPSLNPTAEYSTYKYSPYERQVTRYNAIGGVNWRIPGDEISWQVEVPEEGMYLLTFKVMQNFSRGQSVSRTLRINGEIPFTEAKNIEFKYGTDLQNITVGNNDDLYLYMKKGVNIISLKSTIGIYGETVQQVNQDIKDLRAIYREVVMRTGLNPDPVQDYMLVRNIKNLNERLNVLRDSFKQSKEEIVKISNGRNSLVSAFDRMIYQTDKFLLDEKNIQNGLREFEQNISNLGSWVINVSEQPLTIDSLTVHGAKYKLPRVTTNFFERFWHETVLFFESFKNTGDFGSSLEVDGPTIEVWIGTGRDQATIIRQLIDESFVSQKNVNVKLKMVNMSVLLSATLSGNGPDVAIGVDQKLPVNWGIRNAIKDLTKFEDFNEVKSWFSNSSITPLEYENSVYGLPDTEDFLVTFYRNDILSEIGINSIPKTWDEIIDISPNLQKQYFDFYIPIVQGALSPVLHSMIVQQGGSLYVNGGAESGLLDPNSMKAFLNFTRFFTDYGFVLEANFLNRFRSGEMPIGISSYSTYNSLAVFAPEIQGQWDYGLFPGTIDEDGKINNQTTSSVTASIILEHTKEEQASWEFLKWWLSEDTQVSYARGMEAVLGAAARYPTANLNAFSKLPWPAKDYLLLKQQRENAVGIPTVPGDYIVGRYIDNAFRQVLNDDIIPQDSIYQYHLKINEELRRKRKELGLS
ncbi:extracellular solute-binding protein [Haploplasma axanthum]|uniref:Maltose-binding periplasmic proteins/domains n=1 Tax=Haploplasma axanthum TaxID=29552 RepID=A0A449BBJ0_HAPAX|nr:extracellular solute-binding protein [Haploplasma axanthum]VEU79783.1 Maltose-binding periplasmic proteins/domains [Haploplasma axanthum]